jgi:MFS transporter
MGKKLKPSLSEIPPEDLKFIQDAKIMRKFQFYGFFKNLQFFEPFLIIIFLLWGLSFFQIGILVLIRELFTYLFEIPSGLLADKFIGKKKELLVCFTFYMISFVFYFFGPNFFILIIASIFFGLGESFRSGTHKAMELQWMEKNKILKYKSYVYGKTRSWSLYGSALNSIIAIVMILLIPADKYLFLLAIIPFLLDFILISTYPKYMNDISDKEFESFWKQFKQSFVDLKVIFINRKLRRGVMTSSLYDAIFKTLKDYIQPIIKLFIGVIIIQLMLDQNNDDLYVKVLLGLIYCIFYIVSSFSSKKAYWFSQKVSDTKKAIDLIFDIFAIFLLLEAVFIWIEMPILIILLYMMIYMIYNLRRPMNVGYIGELTPKSQRTTVLSVESQIKAIFIFIFAPIFGLIADIFGIQWLFFIIAIFILIINRFYLRGDCEIEKGVCEDIAPEEDKK